MSVGRNLDKTYTYDLRQDNQVTRLDKIKGGIRNCGGKTTQFVRRQKPMKLDKTD